MIVTVDDQGTIDRLLRDLRKYPDRKVVVKSLRKSLRRPLPAARKAIKARARESLPSGGGLGRWVASTRIGASVKITSTTVRVTVKGGRNSKGGRSDIAAIDRGRVRAKAWGKPVWHQQTVPVGFFTDTLVDGFGGEWDKAAIAAAEDAVKVICDG